MVDAPEQKPRRAWEPLTPGGVAAFADARLGRLWTMQLAVALFCAATIAWCVHQCWFPVISAAIRAAPSSGVIQRSQLHWNGPSPVLLAENTFFAIVVDTNRSGGVRSPAHVQIEFESRRVTVRSLFGTTWEPYPAKTILAANRTELQPWWDAWSPAILALLALGTIAWLFLSWTILATLYVLPIRILAWSARRHPGFPGAWKLCSAALMPGALMLCAGLFLYAFGVLDVIGLSLVCAGHFLAGWAYAIAGTLALPRTTTGPASPSKNPFARD